MLESMVSIPKARTATALLIGLAAAGVTEMTLPAPVFRASAIVAVDEPTPALQLASARNAASLAVSKPVIRRLAMSLDGTHTPVRATDLSATAGDGFVDVGATAPDPRRAARIATALAESLVNEEASIAADAALRHAATAAATLEAAKVGAKRARERLAALGLPDVDPAEASLRAASALRGAEAHLAAVRTVIAAGTPPLGGGSDLPANIAALQQTYWDLKRQYDKATESLGERHTTVIALHDGVDRASANLVAGWQRLERAADIAVSVAKSHEALLRKAADTLDPVKRSAYEAVRAATAAVAQASAAMVAPYPAVPLRLMAPAAIPAEAAGLDASQRSGLTAAAGAAAFLLALLAWPRRRRGDAKPPIVYDREVDELAAPPIEPSFSERLEPFDQETAGIRPALDASLADDGPVASLDPAAPLKDRLDRGAVESDVSDERIADMTSEADCFDLSPAPREVQTIDPDLCDSLRAIAAGLPGSPRGEAAPTVVVAAIAQGAETAAVALALGEAAADLGLRVLVIESDGPRPTLAARVSPDGAPLLVDLSGTLRVALRADRTDGLFVAPALRDGPRLAAGLARHSDVEIVEDLGAAFDAVIIDGGRAADCAHEGIEGDVYLRVGRFASKRDDAHFLDLFGALPTTLLGTVAAGRFLPYAEAPAAPPAAAPPASRPSLRLVGRGRETAAAGRATPGTAPLRVMHRRRINGR